MVTPTLLPYVGGQETYVWKLSEALVSRGHEITILTTDAVSRIPFRRVTSSRQQSGRLRIVRFPCYAFLYSYLPITPRLMLALLAKEIADYDIVHAHGYGHFTSDMAGAACHLFGKPAVLTTHGVHQEMGQEGVIRQLLWFYYRETIVRSTVNSVDRLLVLTEQEVQYLSRFGTETINKTRVVPIGVSLDEFPYPSETKESPRPTILYIGRIDRGKGLEVLVDAASRLARYDPQIVIVGARTGFSATLESLAASRNVSKNLVFAGFVDEETKKRLLQKSMVFCLPSMYEGAGLVLLEAMAAGKPVIATNVGGIPHIVDDGSSGFLVKYGDAKALAERLEQLILNKDLRDSMGKKGREIAENYSWPQVAQEVERVYLELK